MFHEYHIPVIVHLYTVYTLWLFNVAIGHGPFIDDKDDDLPIKDGDFS